MEDDEGDIIVVAACGDVLEIQAFIRWLRGDEKEWPIPDDANFTADVFVLYGDGEVRNCTYFDTPHSQANTPGLPFARGEGYITAKALLHLGMDPVDVIRKTSQIHTSTGGDWVYYYDFNTREYGKVENN